MTMAFSMLLVSGILLICLEIFVPGGVLGVLGAVALIAAMIVSFAAFSANAAMLACVGIILLLGIMIVLWIRYFPKSGIGKAMMLSKTGSDFYAAEEGLEALTGQEGETVSELRPAGFAIIGGRRVDVLTEGEMIAKKTRVRVTRVEGNRVVVRKVDTESTATIDSKGA
ncbi:MAG: hypothetical protein E4H02_10310 [Lentisphaerales bacterium]|jgi:membrane-bound serine protease (ClpP class)|nr:MAG: hypothetical protein E4H02_10310 [Lentisphaerales bacterium]